MANALALEFVRFVVDRNPGVTEFTRLYDAMSRTASMRQFRGLGYRELSDLGVSFSLLATGELDAMIQEVLSDGRQRRF